MKVNGESIYGTTASPFPKAPAWGRVTQKPGKLYLHVFDWPKDGKLVVPSDKSQGESRLSAGRRQPHGVEDRRPAPTALK